MNVLLAQLQETVDQVLAAERQISIGDPVPYNLFVADSETVSSVSASGRVMRGSQAVKAASEQVSKGSVGESDRFVEYLSCDYSDDMFYSVVKTGVTIHKDDGSQNSLCWVITLIFKKFNGVWKLIHRQNTRSNP